MHIAAGSGVVARGFDRDTVTIAPGDERPYDSAEWDGALVVVTRGRIELVGRCGGVVTLGRGDVTWLCDLPLIALRNPGLDDTELTAVRRGGDQSSEADAGGGG